MLKNLYKFKVEIFLLLLVFSACDYKRSSSGDNDKIYVFSDSVLYQSIRPALEQVFDRYIYTPNMEKSFYLEWVPLEQLDSYKMRKNLMFLSVFEMNDPVSQHLNDMISEEVKNAVREGRVFPIYKENIFASDQMGMFFVAQDKDALLTNLRTYSDDIINYLNRYNFVRLEQSMFLKGEQTNLENYIVRAVGWNLRIQYDYQLVKEEPDLIWLKRIDPERNLLIYSFPADSLPVGSDWLMDLRDSLSVIYFENDHIERNDTNSFQTLFLNIPALKLQGIWQNDSLILGGPFRTYAFHNDQTNKVYVLDLSVTAPGKRKKPFLDQLEVMAWSFKVVLQPK